jgi:small subunit ribosomal protein S14
MAKKSSIEHNNLKRRLSQESLKKRLGIKKKLEDRDLSLDDRMTLVHSLAEMKRNSSFVRVRNRCVLSGRSRGYYRKFGFSRIALRELGSAGLIPGLSKASW